MARPSSIETRSIACVVFALSTALLGPAGAHAARLSNITAITVGETFACGLTTAGGVKCWGDTVDGPGTPASMPHDVAGFTSGVVAIAAGDFGRLCAVMTGGGVKCRGEVGGGPVGVPEQLPVDVPGLTSGVGAIAASDKRFCVITTAGGVKCWEETPSTTPVDMPGLASGVTALAISANHTCALTSGGGVKCMGLNSSGQLGDGTTTDRSTAVDVWGLASGVTAIAAGSAHTCALILGGGVKCWGVSSSTGIQTNETTPVDIAGLSSGVVAIGSAQAHTCAVMGTGGLKCWGDNTFGQLGDGTRTRRNTPTDVLGLDSGVAKVAADTWSTCALTTGGQVRCWGYNIQGKIGNGTAADIVTVPVAVGTFTQQAITFDALANRDINELPFTVAATSASGLAVTFRTLASSVCTVSGSTVTLVAIGVCSIAAGQAGDDDYAAAPEVVGSFRVSGSTPASVSRLSSISTRARVSTGDDVAIAGFIIGGSTAKTVVVRARGPSLVSAGVADAMSDTALRLYSSSGFGTNLAWQSDTNSQTLYSIGLAPSDVHEAARLVTLQPGAHTAIMMAEGFGSPSGVGIVEVFEIDRTESPIIGISTRGRVGTGDDVMIAGFVIEGNAPQTVVIRARGPSLVAQGVARALANPTLQLFQGATVIGSNDDWGSASNAAQISASGFAPGHANESAILITLNPGAYTAVVSGVGGSTGVGIVEVFAQ